ncbi:MAG: TadA family conjugal transfer-associated ATPase [Candidatus Nanopelagicales bacterium]
MNAALRQAVRERVIARGGSIDRGSVAAAVRAEGGILDEGVLTRLVDSLLSEMQGAGVLEEYLRDRRVTDLLVNGFGTVWLDRGEGLVQVPSPFPDEGSVRALAVRLAARAGRRLDDASPYVDARLPTGERLHAVLPPVAVGGTTISLRIPSRRQFTLEQLVAGGLVDQSGGAWLRALVAARAAFLVTGGTGSGKTTILGVLLGLVPPTERIVIAEDTTELRPQHPHIVQLESRPANLEGKGAVTLQVLVRQALRMRPDRLVVGEVRGAEVVDLLGALNTGHEGGCGTVHANSAQDVPARLEALALAAGLPAEGAQAQIAAGLDVVLHVVRPAHGVRYLSEIAVVERGDAGLRVVPALRRDKAGPLAPGPGFARLEQRIGPWRR